MEELEKARWKVAGKAFGADPDYQNLRALDRWIKKNPASFNFRSGQLRERGELIRAILLRVGLVYL